MEKSSEETIDQKSEINPGGSGMGQFAVKTAIIVFGLYALISLSLPDFGEIKEDFKREVKRFDTPAGKLFLLGLVQNPVALWKYSEIQEVAGNTESAISNMELAIGLIEMHGANNQMLKRYADRLEKLKTKKN